MRAINQLADEMLALLFAAEPLQASLLGVPGWDDRLGAQDVAAERRRAKALTEVIARVDALDPAELSESDRLTSAVVRQQAGAALDTLAAGEVEFLVSDGLAAPVPHVVLRCRIS